MENWTEEDLAKLPMKELKSLAKKNNLNPNFKKAELVMVLLNSFKNTADCSGTTIQPQTSKRITRSRVSLWHASNETSDHVKEEKLNKHISDLNSDSKASVDDKSVNKKRKKATDTMTDFDTAEMFPLVSSIKLTSKPLVIITNSESAATTSKRSKRNKVQDEINNKLDILPSDSAKLDIKALTLNPCLETEISEQDCNLNNTFTVEHGRSASPDNNRKSKKRKRGAGNKEQAKDEQNGIAVGKENQSDCRKDISVAESKSSYEKPTRGSKRRQTESPIEDDVSLENSAVQREPLKMFVSVEENLQDSNKRKKKKGNDKNRVEPVDKILNNTESSPVKDSDLTGPSNSSTDQVNKLSSSNSVQRDDLKKKIRNNSEQENQNQTLETNVISPEEAAKDGKRKRSKKNKKQGRNKTTYSPNTHESTELVEATSSLQRSSRRSQSLPMGQKEVECNNECSSVEKKLTNGHNNSNGNIEEDNVKGETGEKGIQGPIRSSTFIVSDTSAPEESEEMPVPAQKRNSLFILCDSGRKSSHNRSLRFSPRPTLEKKANTSQNNGRLEKSIGQRIMKSSAKLGNESTLRKEQGSAIKKNIVSTRTGSVFKKSPATKMPDFKKIHQQLFNNMESLSDNKKRQQDRAKGLLMSPAPRCAIHTPKLTTNRPLQDSNSKKSTFCPVQSNKVKTPVAASPLAAKLKTPAPSKTPVSKKPVPAASSVNRFGFRKPVKKEDATILVGKKLPLVNLEKKKEQDRNILKGVRMNKRFILQMKMRQGLTSEK